MKIAFRVDANPHIGMGHLSRCLSIAACLAQNGHSPLLITADASTRHLIEAKGFSSVCLDSSYNVMGSELDKLTHIIAEHKIQRLVIDSYFVTEEYLGALRNIVKTIYLDDVNAFAYPASLLINYNLYGSDFDYSQIQERYGTKLLVGPAYAPLREEFSLQSPALPRKKAQHVLVSTGGADPMHLGEKITGALLSAFNDLTIHWVAGAFAETSSIESQRLIIYRNVTAMAELILRCDVAISAAGFTLYELCACGVPTLSYAFADNQLFGARAFDAQKIIPWAGDFRESPKECLARIIAEVGRLQGSYERRREQSFRMRQLVDGKGAGRIAREIGE